MAITNVSKPTTTLSNSSKVSIEETWDSNTTTWNSETRTWDDMASTIDNQSKVINGSLWLSSVLPWQLSTPWVTTGNITNVSKP